MLCGALGNHGVNVPSLAEMEALEEGKDNAKNRVLNQKTLAAAAGFAPLIPRWILRHWRQPNVRLRESGNPSQSALWILPCVAKRIRMKSPVFLVLVQVV